MHKQIAQLPAQISALAKALGLNETRISAGQTAEASKKLRDWLAKGFHGDMGFMANHADLRCQPKTLVPGTLTIISTSLNYWPNAAEAQAVLKTPDQAYISRYALGRDYHKVLRQKLQKLANRIEEHIGPFGYRVFSDSAPVMEVEFAEQAKLGWRGKHSLLLNRLGSWHFLGEIYTDLPLPTETKKSPSHCGNCTRCIDVCPTRAIVEPYVVDARRCISYLTIELKGSIPVEHRPAIGNRIYGCDDCQLCCPWNRFAQLGDPNFNPRNQLDQISLCELFSWSENIFLDRFSGSPIRRIGHQQWQRNIAVALGNLLNNDHPNDIESHIRHTLQNHTNPNSELVSEHVHWALAQGKR